MLGQVAGPPYLCQPSPPSAGGRAEQLFLLRILQFLDFIACLWGWMALAFHRFKHPCCCSEKCKRNVVLLISFLRSFGQMESTHLKHLLSGSPDRTSPSLTLAHLSSRVSHCLICFPLLRQEVNNSICRRRDNLLLGMSELRTIVIWVRSGKYNLYT